MVALGTDHGVKTVALLTDMDTPLGLHRGQRARGARVGRGAGRRRPGRRRRADPRAGPRDARRRPGLTDVDPADELADGSAMDVWRAMIRAQGGDPDAPNCRWPGRTTSSPRPRTACWPAWTRFAVGVAAWRLGAGRARKEDPVQAGAGVELARQARRHRHRRPAAVHPAHRHPGARSTRRWKAWRALAIIADVPATAVHAGRRSVVDRSRRLRTPSRCAGSHATERDLIRARPKVLLHDHLDGGLRPQTIIELADAVGYTELPEPRRRRRSAAGSARPPTPARWSATWRPSTHTVGGHADRRRAVPGRRRVRRGPRRRRRRLRRGRATRPSSTCERGLTLDEVVEAVRRGLPRGRAAGRRGRAPDPGRRRCSPRCGTPPARARSPSWRCATATAAWSASTSPAPRPATRPPGTWTRSSTCGARTSTSPSTPARRSGCRRSGRRSSGAAPTGSATACGSSTTSRSTPTARRRSAGWPQYVRDKRIPLEMCPYVERADRRRRARSPSTRSGCCASCTSGSRSTPTTG